MNYYYRFLCLYYSFRQRQFSNIFYSRHKAACHMERTLAPIIHSFVVEIETKEYSVCSNLILLLIRSFYIELKNRKESISFCAYRWLAHKNQRKKIKYNSNRREEKTHNDSINSVNSVLISSWKHFSFDKTNNMNVVWRIRFCFLHFFNIDENGFTFIRTIPVRSFRLTHS